MYDFPWLRPATDALWTALAGRLRGGLPHVPEALDRDRGLDALWHDPDLIFSQTCGLPYASHLRGVVRLVASPCYGFVGCDGPRWGSVVIARTDGPRSLSDAHGLRAAINGRDSNTGMNLLRHAVAPLAGGRRFFSAVTVTGTHLASIDAVRTGTADIAAVDCVTHGQVGRGEPERLTGTVVIGLTARTPGLPFVMAARLAHHLPAVRDALTSVLADPSLAATRDAVGLTGAVVLDDTEYDAVLELERDAVARGYPELA